MLEDWCGGLYGGDAGGPRPVWPPSWRTRLVARWRCWLRVMPLGDAGGYGCGVDGLPVLYEEVPLDGGEAELAGDAEDGGAAGSVGGAEVADGDAEGVFEGLRCRR